jgi:hypothetical protein
VRLRSRAAQWYFRDVSRQEAITLLQGQHEGAFLVRPSTTATYALSFVADTGIVAHATLNQVRARVSRSRVRVPIVVVGAGWLEARDTRGTTSDARRVVATLSLFELRLLALRAFK